MAAADGSLLLPVPVLFTKLSNGTHNASSSGVKHGVEAKAPKMSLSPTVKHAGQYSCGSLRKMFKF